jgi:hypothetical protein
MVKVTFFISSQRPSSCQRVAASTHTHLRVAATTGDQAPAIPVPGPCNRPFVSANRSPLGAERWSSEDHNSAAIRSSNDARVGTR